MIPKIIHYCWFGKNKMPQLAKKCIKSWKKYCKGFKIQRWDEHNFDIMAAPPYVQEAYSAKKWAFVTDYVRLLVVYNFGGIYFDVDVEILKSFDSLLENRAFFGFEDFKKDGKYFLATGLGFGSESKLELLKEIMRDYDNISFYKENGRYDLTPCPERNSSHFVKHGFKLDGTLQFIDGIKLFPVDYFCPIKWETGEKTISKNTFSIHHFAASWHDKNKNINFFKRILYKVIRKLQLLGGKK